TRKETIGNSDDEIAASRERGTGIGLVAFEWCRVDRPPPSFHPDVRPWLQHIRQGLFMCATPHRTLPRAPQRGSSWFIGPILLVLAAALSRKPRLFPRSGHSSPNLFLNYMSSRELEQFDKHLKLRCPWIFEPSLAGRADAL